MSTKTEQFTTASGSGTKDTEKAFSLGLVERNMKVTINSIEDILITGF